MPSLNEAADKKNRPTIMRLTIHDQAALYAAYISLFPEGGIFIPTEDSHRLGDEVYVLLTLPQEERRYPIAGKVAWITPARAVDGRTQGIGVKFPKDEAAQQLKRKIEDMLGDALQSSRPTHTL